MRNADERARGARRGSWGGVDAWKEDRGVATVEGGDEKVEVIIPLEQWPHDLAYARLGRRATVIKRRRPIVRRISS